MNYPNSATIGGLDISPPWMNASGFLATAPALQRFAGYNVGAVVAKTLQTTEEKGNETPVFVEDGSGNCYNSIGLSGQGVYKFASEMRQYPLPPGKKLVVSITSKKSLDDLKAAAEQVLTLADDFDLILELNWGCPNVKDGMVVGKTPSLAYEWTAAVNSMAGRVPVMAKLTPNVEDPAYIQVAQACTDAGADALVMINTIAETYNNPHTGRPHFRFGGGKSGHNIFDETIRHVEAAADMLSKGSYNTAIGAVGGIDSSERARKCFEAGADFIQSGTYAFLDRPMEIRRRTEPDLETAKDFFERMHREIYGD